MSIAFDNANARPRLDSAHVLSFMHNSLSYGYNLSRNCMSDGQYENLPDGYSIAGMQTVFETRRTRLMMLVKRYGSVAKLNKEIGWEVTNARLYQIHNRSIRSDRGTPFEMGDPTAREIEEKLSLGLGWMDTPPTYLELLGEEDPRSKALIAMEALPPEKWGMALRLINTLLEPDAHAAPPVPTPRTNEITVNNRGDPSKQAPPAKIKASG